VSGRKIPEHGLALATSCRPPTLNERVNKLLLLLEKRRARPIDFSRGQRDSIYFLINRYCRRRRTAFGGGVPTMSAVGPEAVKFLDTLESIEPELRTSASDIRRVTRATS